MVAAIAAGDGEQWVGSVLLDGEYGLSGAALGVPVTLGPAGVERVVEWELDAGAGIGRDRAGRQDTLRPFLGVIGMPPAAPGVHPTGPPRACGGNIDCKELVAGTALLLPIAVDGALVSAGDGHAAQGDGVGGQPLQRHDGQHRLVAVERPHRLPELRQKSG